MIKRGAPVHNVNKTGALPFLSHNWSELRRSFVNAPAKSDVRLPFSSIFLIASEVEKKDAGQRL